jgi:ankyrin repeat protein
MLFIAQIFVLGLLLSRCEAESVLMRAVAADDVDQLKALVEDNNDINSIGDGGQTPLMRACLTGKVAALRWLLAAGADMQIGEKDGYICPHGVGYQGRSEAVKVLFEHGGLDILLHKHQDGFTAIHRACWGSEARHTETVRQMLKVSDKPLAV